MAYSKTTWVDNVTDIDKDNLNKIEQGIYDNSLVVDAVTDKLNPTDTETYKTAELTEGQITDVIGVNDIVIKGQTSQDGTPTPSAPVDVNVVSGSNVIDIYNNQTLSKELPLDLGSIELCKIGNYQDYFYKSGSKWYLHKETLKIIIPSSVNGTMQNSNKRFFVNKTNLNNCDILKTSSASQTYGLYCDILKEVTAGQTWTGNQGISYDHNATPNASGIDFSINGLTTVAEYQEALAGKIIIAKLNTPTDTEITNTTLISQLESIYNAPLYEQTNITQENNDLPMVLDITACKDNINGIKAWIRR